MNLLVGNKTVEALPCSMLGVKASAVSHQYRIANIDRLRIVSALGIVCFHADDGDSAFTRSFGTVGILVFLLSFCAFVVNRPEPHDLGAVLKRKARRLLKPWLFWSVIYGALKLAKVVFRNVPLSEAFSPRMLLIGGWIHLWFLPFAFVVAMLLVLVHRGIAAAPDQCTIVSVILIGALSVVVFSIVQSRMQLPAPLGQWTLGLPAMFLGFALGRIMIVRKAENRGYLHLFVVLSTTAACVVTALLSNGLWSDHATTFVIRYCVSLAAVCLALQWQGSLDPITRKLASLSYGIYLVHNLVIIALYELGVAVQYPPVSLLLVFSISALATHVLKKTPLKQFV